MNKRLQEGVDFYFDKNGLLVFTAHYLTERGYCCGNGCRHCPYSDNSPAANNVTGKQKPAVN
ncbi:MAG TPA: hypothetical protein DHW15_10255 [Bacteroidetes bacterium]|nr:MAG: hypothetical protein ABR95_12070 [Sphingobacteriales bacterium BACL12 MAG-120813-bin55]HCK22520.1 hypothetical protein [Bacteroidota bacterium]